MSKSPTRVGVCKLTGDMVARAGCIGPGNITKHRSETKNLLDRKEEQISGHAKALFLLLEDFSMHKVPTFVGNRGHALDEHLIKAVWKEIEGLEVQSKQIKTILTHIRHRPPSSTVVRHCSSSNLPSLYAAVVVVAAASAVAAAAPAAEFGSINSPKFWFSNSIIKIEQSSPWNLGDKWHAGPNFGCDSKYILCIHQRFADSILCVHHFWFSYLSRLTLYHAPVSCCLQDKIIGSESCYTHLTRVVIVWHHRSWHSKLLTHSRIDTRPGCKRHALAPLLVEAQRAQTLSNWGIPMDSQWVPNKFTMNS